MTSAPRDRDLLRSGVITSSFCSGGDCVGVRPTDTGVEVVDTKDVAASLQFGYAEWTAFVAGIKAGEFDLEP